MASTKKTADMTAFFLEQVADIGLESLEGSVAYKAFLKGLPRGTQNKVISGSRRLSAFNVIKWGYPLHPRYNLSVFEVEALGFGDDTCIYAMAFWPEGAEFPEYICLGGTFESQDGEFRRNFTWWDDFEEAFEKIQAVETDLPENEQVLGRIEKGLRELLDDSDLVYTTYVFSSPTGQGTLEEQRIATRCNELRLAHRTFVAQLCLAGGELHAPHILPRYGTVMKNVLEALHDDIPERELSPQKAGESDADFEKRKKIVNRFRYLRGKWSCGIPGGRALLCMGVKFVPLRRIEATQVGDLRHPTWREVWMGQKATDLTINGRAATFPILNQWSVINAVTSSMFENEAMDVLFTMSRQIERSVEKIHDARYALEEDSELKTTPALFKEIDFNYHSAAAEAERHILSGLTLMMSQQYVGPTFGTIATGAYRSPLAGGLEGKELSSAIFEIVYGCLVMHETGIHSDLHINNMTVNSLWSQEHAPPETCNFYVAGPDGERDTFVVPTYGAAGYIIDFSRAIITPARKAELDREMGVEETRLFYEEQVKRMFHVLHMWEPSIAKKYEDKFKAAAYGSPQALYNVLTAVDFVSIGHNIGKLLKKSLAANEKIKATGGTVPWEVAPECIALCEKLEEAGREVLLEGLHKVVIRGPIKDTEAPTRAGLAVMKKTFNDLLYSRWDPAKLAVYVLGDGFNAHAPMKYSSDKVENFPPWAQVETVMKFAGGRSLEEIFSRGIEPLHNSIQVREDGLGDETFELAVEKERSVASRPIVNYAKSWLA